MIHNIPFNIFYSLSQFTKSTGKRFDETAKGLMVEAHTEPLYNITESTTGGVTYRSYKRQRIKFNSSIYFLDPIYNNNEDGCDSTNTTYS